MQTANDFIKRHEDSIIMVWSLTKRLFELTEQLAEKEIEDDPKGFIIRETLANKRNSQKHTSFGNQLIPEKREQLFEEEFKNVS